MLYVGNKYQTEKLPSAKDLKKFFDIISKRLTFQLEQGALKNKLHYQGGFIISGPRVSKKQ